VFVAWLAHMQIDRFVPIHSLLTLIRIIPIHVYTIWYRWTSEQIHGVNERRKHGSDIQQKEPYKESITIMSPFVVVYDIHNMMIVYHYYHLEITYVIAMHVRYMVILMRLNHNRHRTMRHAPSLITSHHIIIHKCMSWCDTYFAKITRDIGRNCA
jgi:hypothetical protein